MITDPKKLRTPKTPRQRAEEALAVEDRRVTKITARRDTLATDLDASHKELAQATARRDYLAQSPDLAPVTGHRDRQADTDTKEQP